MTNHYKQRSDEKRLYQQVVQGDTIASAVWTLNPAGTITSPANTSSTTTVLISNLTPGATHHGTIHIVAVSGQEFDARFKIDCHPPPE